MVTFGPCAHGQFDARPEYGLREMQTDQFDYVVVRTHAFDAPATNGHIAVALTYDLVAANWFEVFPGKNLELTMRGVSKIEVSLSPLQIVCKGSCSLILHFSGRGAATRYPKTACPTRMCTTRGMSVSFIVSS